MQSEILLTEDGSHTLYVPAIDESYHSTHGAIQESMHIFIKNGLATYLKKNNITVFEVGFGTGLNAYLSLLEALQNKVHINYITVERFPVATEKATMLNYPELNENKNRQDFEKLHTCKWNEKVAINDYFSITKLEVDFNRFECYENFDVCFFDAFSPEKQASMWTNDRFEMLHRHSNDAATLTTYCAKGIIRRRLQNIGFTVERLPGPPGKREILKATKMSRPK